MDKLIFAVIAIRLSVAASYSVSIYPYNKVIVKEYQDLVIDCHFDQRINVIPGWSVILKLAGVDLTAFGWFDDPNCDYNGTTYDNLKYMISCNKSENSIKLKLFHVSSTKHGTEIECILRINRILYKNTTSIYVQVPVKSVTIQSKQNKLTTKGHKQFLLECESSPSRPAANIQWSILHRENGGQIGLFKTSQTKTLEQESDLWTTTSYLNYLTDCIQNKQTIACEAVGNSSNASTTATLDITCNPSMELDSDEIDTLKVLNTTCSNNASSDSSWLQEGLKEDIKLPAGHFIYVQTIGGQTTYTCLVINDNGNKTENLNITGITATSSTTIFLLKNWSLFAASFLLLTSLVMVLVAWFVYRRLRQWRTLAKRQNINMQLLQEIMNQYIQIDPRIYENNCRTAELNSVLPYSNLLPPTENPYYSSVANNI